MAGHCDRAAAPRCTGQGPLQRRLWWTAWARA